MPFQLTRQSLVDHITTSLLTAYETVRVTQKITTVDFPREKFLVWNEMFCPWVYVILWVYFTILSTLWKLTEERVMVSVCLSICERLVQTCHFLLPDWPWPTLVFLNPRLSPHIIYIICLFAPVLNLFIIHLNTNFGMASNPACRYKLTHKNNQVKMIILFVGVVCDSFSIGTIKS